MDPIPAIAELKTQPQWVLWRYETRPGDTKPTKPPYQSYGQHASTTDPKTWCSYDEAANAQTRFNGKGFVVSENDPYCGIDLDGCIDEAGEVAEWALKEVRRFQSYTEITPTGRGLRIWIRGRIKGSGRNKRLSETEGIEVYDRARYFTVTERPFGETSDQIEERQDELDQFLAEQFPKAEIAKPPAPKKAAPLSDRELLEKAFAAKNGHVFRALWEGDYKSAGYESASEATLALCCQLRFWTDGDANRMDRLFRQSGLMRDKWDEKRGNTTWGAREIEKALQGGGDGYRPLSGDLPRISREKSGVEVSDPFVPEITPEEGLPRFPRLPRTPGEILKPDDWPAPLAEEAFYGFPGEFVQQVEPHTEADPAALLLSFLCAAGNMLGIHRHMRVGPKVHRMREFVALVGPTSSGRKGTSMEFSLDLMKRVDPSWQWETGMSSGEGLIWMVRDAITKKIPRKEKGDIIGYQDEITDHGVTDKRRLVVEEEFASVLRAVSREGNTLSATLRQVWDRDEYQSLTKNSPAKATGAHVSCIVHITPEELLRNLSAVEVANGFANRFLWICSMRARLLPDGGEQVNIQSLADSLNTLRLTCMHACEMRRDKQAAAVWATVYPLLTMDRPGMLGAVTSRAEAHVLRLSGIYAALDGGHQIRLPHLLAALSVWDYSLASARFLFGDSIGEPVADIMLDALRKAAPEGLARNSVREDVFQRHVSSERIDLAIETLECLGQLQVVKESTGGRPRQMLYATGGQKGRAGGFLDIAKQFAQVFEDT
jgi:hypothetical protein